MMTPKVVAVMPIKMENERLPGKNIKLLGEKPLLQYELDNLLQIKDIDDIYVFCSKSEICRYIPNGVKWLSRPEFLDLPTSNFTQIFKVFSDIIDADIYVYAHATAPFIMKETMEICLQAVKSGVYDSAFCARKIQDFLWKDNEPLNFDATNIPRSQDIEPIYQETSGIYVFTKDVFKKYGTRIGRKPYIHAVTFKEAVDINHVEDFELAEILLNS